MNVYTRINGKLAHFLVDTDDLVIARQMVQAHLKIKGLDAPNSPVLAVVRA